MGVFLQKRFHYLRYPLKNAARSFFLCLRYIFDWICLAYVIRRNPPLKDKPQIVLCMANPGSIGGTELQIEIIAAALKKNLGSCLILFSGKVEAGKSNLFLKRLGSYKIPFIHLKSLGLIPYHEWPILKKGTKYLLNKVIKNSKICHFFNPSSTHLAPVIQSLGLSIYYMETGMPVAEGWWKTLYTTMIHFNYVTSVSTEGLNRLQLLYGYRGPSCVIPSMIHPIPARFRCRDPIEEVLNIVYFGRMTRGKGVDLLIQAFGQLIQEFPYAKLNLIGSGERLPILHQLVHELHLSKNVHFTPWLQNEELFSQLITQDLFCLPSFTEGLPSSILEAMSIGLPILSTTVGGIPEIIEHNVSGVLIPPRNLEALTKALLELAHQPQRRLQLREEAFLRWEKVGAQEVVIPRLMATYGIA
jgi:glycosyltransferase involved in cell wall biosynthesis